MNEFKIQPKKVTPKIYAYRDFRYPDLIKIGQTSRKTVEERIKEQTNAVKQPIDKPYELLGQWNAVRTDGTVFTDHDIHKNLEKKGIYKVNKSEFFKCDLSEVSSAVLEVKNYKTYKTRRKYDFRMRPEQKAAVFRTKEYFEKAFCEGFKPRYLWNCKMRFGKTFTAYQFAKAMNFKKVLVLTFKPAAEEAWHDDLLYHTDFDGWQFTAGTDSDFGQNIDFNKPLVCFGSFQDILGKDKNKLYSPKKKNQWVHELDWDLVIFDEYHFGAWNDNAASLFDEDNYINILENYERDQEDVKKRNDEEYDFDWIPITTRSYLLLSGTPFKALNSGEFLEDQKYDWTYTDEQKAKAGWKSEDGINPYRALPRIIMFTYQLPENIERIAKDGEFNEFDLNTFFIATGSGKNARFVHEDEVQMWLDLIRGQYVETIREGLTTKSKVPMPFSDKSLRDILQHTLWFLPNIASCEAMYNLLNSKANSFYASNYKIILACGKHIGSGRQGLHDLEKQMGNPLETQSITLSCGKLTTGVTVKAWSGILMLRNLRSPETYFQAAFRVQSPYTIKDPDDSSKEIIIKEDCFIFDFAPNRALSQIAEYSNKLDASIGMNHKEKSTIDKVNDFLEFLPVLAYKDYSFSQVDAKDILDIITSGTANTMLARKWQSAMLVNVDNNTLEKVLNNEKALEAISKIIGYRNIKKSKKDLLTIINKSNAVKEAKRNSTDKTPSQKRKLSEEEKAYKSIRQKIREKLIHFSTRIPIFMYATDYREETLYDVITKIEPKLFKRVTGLGVSDFELLVSLNLFNKDKMNDAVLAFRLNEDDSMVYMGINRQSNTIGLYDTKLKRDEVNLIN